jgi:hypothetical protein
MAIPPARAFYRIVRTDPPIVDDFLPYEARGGKPPDEPYLRRLWQGVSVYDTANRARNRALKQPHLGRYIAELRIAWGSGIHAERTGHRRGHHTLWGEPAALLASVVAVVPL